VNRGSRFSRACVGTVAVIAGVAVLAGGCSGDDEPATTAPPATVVDKVVDEDQGPPQRGGTLRVGLQGESENLSPVGAVWGTSTYAVALSIMEPLAAYDVDRHLQPYLAKTFTHNDDFTEWTISMREGVTMSDGRPVDAALIKTNLDAQRAGIVSGFPWAFVLPGEEGVKVVDARTVAVRMNRPWSTFPHLLTSQAGMVASPETLTDAGKAKPVGSGPFVLKSWERDRKLVVTRNPTYWRSGYPYLDEVEFRPLPDVGSRGKALESGDVNIIETGDPAQITAMSAAAQDRKVQMFTADPTNSPKWALALNVSAAPFDDIVARQAVAHAIDTAAISKALYQGVLPPVKSAFGDADPFHVDVPEYPGFDVEEARRLARDYEARHGQPLAFTALLGPNGGGPLGLTIQQQLRDAGIELTISNQSGAGAGVAVAYGNYQASISIFFGSPHIDREFVFLASKAEKAGLSLNLTRIGVGPDGAPTGENDRIVEAMTAARATDDPAEQKRQYEVVQHEMAKNLNLVFLVGQSFAVVADADTHGLLGSKLPGADGGDGPELLRTGLILTASLWRSPR
jgi:peptide/nickel transport system substrate-binding protein